MKVKYLVPVALAGLMMIAGCGSSVNPDGSVSSSASTTASSAQSSSDSTYKKANGTYDFTARSFEEKAEITAKLEKYGMEKHIAGIPLYDDAGYELFSDRVISQLPTQTYITNYGFGVGNASIVGDSMFKGTTIKESKAEWKPYFHSYTSTDSGTLNYWDSQGSDVADRNSMVSASYFGVTMNDTKDNFLWRGELSTENRPIMLDAKGGNPVTDATALKSASKWWRVKLHHDDPKYVYTTTSSTYASFNGQQIKLADYITPFKAMMDANLYRVSSLEATATGFTGVASYVNSSKKDWSTVGIQENDTEGSLDFEFITPKTSYYAMTDLSSTLFSPVPENFVKALGTGGSFAGGAKNYGKIGTSSDATANADNILSCGPYTVSYWEKDKEMVYIKNPAYFLGDEIKFPGMTEVVISGTSAAELAFQAFLNGELDSIEVPSDQLKDYSSSANALHTLGSTVLKMNLNSCTQDEWDYYFGEEGKVYRHKKTGAWDVKPLMSNDDFLDGVYFSINRQQLATLSGHNPAMGYLSSAYMYDPENGLAYRDSDAGKAAIAAYTSADKDGYGYNVDLAKTLFKRAIATLEANGDYTRGTESEPTEIRLKYFFRYEETIKNYGNTLAAYVTDAFNAANPGYKLYIDMAQGGSSYTDTYTLMDHGEYDLADGAIQGNVLNPLEFMSCLCSDGLAQGFCLNWGEITANVSAVNPLVYDNLVWSYDGLYSAGNGRTVITDGQANTPITKAYYSDDDTYAIFAGSIPEIYTDEGDPLIEYAVNEIAVYFAKNLEFADGTYQGYGMGSYIGRGIEVERTEGYYLLKIKKSLLSQYAANVGTSLKMNITAVAVNFKVDYTMDGTTDNTTMQWEVNLSDIGVTPYTYNA